MKKEKMLHYNPNTGILEECRAIMGRCPFGSENHFPESKLKEAQAYADKMNKKLAEEEKKRKIANPCPLTTHMKDESNDLKEEKDTSHLEWRRGEHGMELRRFKSNIGNSPFGPIKIPDTNMTRLEAEIMDLAISQDRPIPQKKELEDKHYSSREEAMRDVENQAELKENSEDYTEKKIPKHYSSREESIKEAEKYSENKHQNNSEKDKENEQPAESNYNYNEESPKISLSGNLDYDIKYDIKVTPSGLKKSEDIVVLT